MGTLVKHNVASMLSASLILLLVISIIPLFAHRAEASSTDFTSDTTIADDMTINAGETWTVYGATLTISPGVIITNNGVININSATVHNEGTINSAGTIRFIGGRMNNDGIVNSYGVIINGPMDPGILNNNFDTLW